MKLSPLPPGAPESLRGFLTDLLEVARELLTPGAPVKEFACLEASLPPAADHPGRRVLLSDARIPVWSTYDSIAAVWEWTKADGSAI